MIRIYIDTNDMWVGLYRGRTHYYFCPLPMLVVRVGRWTSGGAGTAKGCHDRG